MFVFKAMHIIAVHNFRAGGTTRGRILTFSDYCMQSMSDRFSFAYLWYLKLHFRLKLWLFENFFSLYERLFGFMRVSLDGPDGAIVEEVVGRGAGDFKHPNK